MNPPPVDQSIHPRDAAIEQAVSELLPWVNAWRVKYGLTVMELVFVWNQLIGRTTRDELLSDRERSRSRDLEVMLMTTIHDPNNHLTPEAVVKIKKLLGMA